MVAFYLSFDIYYKLKILMESYSYEINMSLFYETLTREEGIHFQNRKQKFKAGKPCAVCGRTLAMEKMMVAHLIPVRELTNKAALFDESNWEVRCIECERRLHHEEQIINNQAPSDEQDPDSVYYLRSKRQGILQNRKRHRNLYSAQQEVRVRRLENKLRKKGRHTKRRRAEHPKDDYYNRFD